MLCIIISMKYTKKYEKLFLKSSYAFAKAQKKGRIYTKIHSPDLCYGTAYFFIFFRSPKNAPATMPIVTNPSIGTVGA